MFLLVLKVVSFREVLGGFGVQKDTAVGVGMAWKAVRVAKFFFAFL